MSENNICESWVVEKKSKFSWHVVFFFVLTTLLCTLTSLTRGFFVGVSFLLALFAIHIILRNYGQRGALFQYFFLWILALFNFYAPSGFLMHTKHGTTLIKEYTFVWPHVHVSPMEKAPKMQGQFLVKNTLPENWSVSIWYWIPPNTELESVNWEMFQKDVSEGVEIPTTLLTLESEPNILIEKYFEMRYPFMHTEIEVVYTDVK